MPIRSGSCPGALLPDSSVIVSWLASSPQHFENKPAAISKPVVVLMMGGASFVSMILRISRHLISKRSFASSFQVAQESAAHGASRGPTSHMPLLGWKEKAKSCNLRHDSQVAAGAKHRRGHNSANSFVQD
jgi:hypothetical protein